MAIRVINKINSRLRFLYRQNRFLNFPLGRLLCNAMIQTFFDYSCNGWYPNIRNKLKMHLQAAQNKCIRFCLNLNGRSSIKYEDFEKRNWLLIHERVWKCSVCSINKFFTKNCPNYFEEIYAPFEADGIHTRSSYQELNVPHWKTNVGQKALSYVGLSLRNNLNKTLKTLTSLNSFKHNIKKHFFTELEKRES